MHLTDYEGWYTVVMVIIFLGIVRWAWSGKRQKGFSEAAKLPFEEPEFPRVHAEKKETGHE